MAELPVARSTLTVAGRVRVVREQREPANLHRGRLGIGRKAAHRRLAELAALASEGDERCGRVAAELVAMDFAGLVDRGAGGRADGDAEGGHCWAVRGQL